MKILRVIFLSLSLAVFIIPILPAQADISSTDSSCSCTCCKTQSSTFSTGTPGPGTINPTQIVTSCGDKADDTPAVKADSDTACAKTCSGKGDGYAVRSCIKGDCWCKNDKDAQFIGQSSDAGACQKACTDAKLTFGNFGSPPATTTSAVKCPPGGMWTPEECTAQTDSSGAHIGEWLPPDSATTKGPYCFVAQNPVKLSIAIGGLSSANLAQYLSAAYRLGLGIAAVLAVIFIMIGGFRYITAAGGSGVEGAKELIKNAVIGLALTAFSYTLLQTVNPDILSLRLPRVQLVKPCNVGVSCAARSTKDVCEKNDPSSGMRCIWNINSSVCYENSANESGALGQNGGDCQKSGDSFTCTDGSKCISIASYNNKCSQGKACQACKADTDCATQNGSPGKCDLGSNVCVVADPNGAPGSYLKCNNGTCKQNTDCDTGFCNGSGRCAPSNQGASCLVSGQKDCGSGYTCTEFFKPFQETPTSPIQNLTWKKLCCLDGQTSGCMGCALDSDCPNTTQYYCMDQARYDKSAKDPKTLFKCMLKS